MSGREGCPGLSIRALYQANMNCRRAGVDLDLLLDLGFSVSAAVRDVLEDPRLVGTVDVVALGREVAARYIEKEGGSMGTEQASACQELMEVHTRWLAANLKQG